MEPQLLVAVLGILGPPLLAFLMWFLRDWHIRSVERKAVTRSLLADVYRLVDVIDGHLKWWCDNIENKRTDQPLIPFSTEFFDLIKDKMTIITDENIIQDLVQYYGYIKFANAFQEKQNVYQQRKKTDRFDRMYLSILLRLARDFGPERFKPHFAAAGFPLETALERNEKLVERAEDLLSRL